MGRGGGEVRHERPMINHKIRLFHNSFTLTTRLMFWGPRSRRASPFRSGNMGSTGA